MPSTSSTPGAAPSDVAQDLGRDVPGEIGPALGAAPGVLEVLGIKVVLIAQDAVRYRADARIRGHIAVVGAVDLAAEAADVRPLLNGVHPVVARPSGRG